VEAGARWSRPYVTVGLPPSGKRAALFAPLRSALLFRCCASRGLASRLARLSSPHRFAGFIRASTQSPAGL